MYLVKVVKLFVCLVLSATFLAADADAWNPYQIALGDKQEDLFVQASGKTDAITKVKPKPIVKVKPPAPPVSPLLPPEPFRLVTDCALPLTRPSGFDLEADALFGRIKGKLRYTRGPQAWLPTSQQDLDINSDLMLPTNRVIPTITAKYRVTPNFALRYSLMPSVVEGTGTLTSTFNFGQMTFVWGQNVRSRWERFYHRAGIVFDPIHTSSSRVSIFGDYVRIDEKLSVIQVGCCGENLESDMNMAMAGLEFEGCLKTTRNMSTLSVEARAGMAFGDDSMGGDVSGGLKFSVPITNGRWGFVKGGYRYVTFKKKYSDVKLTDTAMDGGFVQVGLVF
jgi:hypothetical protein